MNNSKGISVLFIQGGGEGGHQADQSMVDSLQKSLGEQFKVHYPVLYSEESSSDYGWIEQIGVELFKFHSPIVLVGHSFGASMILKYLTENPSSKIFRGIFLLATPYWRGDQQWVQGIKLKDGFENNLSAEVPIIFYHCQDDREVSISHLEHYKQHLPCAIYRTIKRGGHQLGNDLSMVAVDIKHC